MTAIMTQSLNWDSFLSENVNRGVMLRFRERAWLNIRREIAQRLKISLDDVIEPCWASPGESFYWQKQADAEDGTASRWTRIGPYFSGSGAEIVRRLEKGLRLRPPDGVGVEASETADSSTGSRPSVEKSFTCNRHWKDTYAFPTRKGYLRHCRQKNEVPEEKVLGLDEGRTDGYQWYCAVHDIGFTTNQRRLAAQHIRESPVVSTAHPRLEDMHLVREADTPSYPKKKVAVAKTRY